MKKLMSGLLVLVLFMMLPAAVSAKSFDIEGFDIDAQLEENGQVHVTEELTYRFSGSFNGITRAIYPKKGSTIKGLEASENGTELTVEGGAGDYKIHRKAKDETVKIQLTYTIAGGVRGYSDMADFNWPFFDDRNETAFQDVSITIHPPAAVPAGDVIAFGYDAALAEPVIDQDGTVTFRLGKIPSEKNADIRVGYPAGLFPALSTSSAAVIGPELLKEKEQQEAKLARFEKFEEIGRTAAPVTLGIGIAIFAALLVNMGRRKKDRIKEAEDTYPDPYFVPEQEMSLPATLKFTQDLAKPESLQTAALLDLMRKGYIARDGEDGFRMLSRATDHEHERLLLEWLFDDLGDGETFRFSDMDVFSGKNKAAEKAAAAYSKAQSEWNAAVSKEVSEAGLKEKAPVYAWMSILAGLVLIPLMIGYAYYGHPWWLLGFIPLVLLLIVTGIFNRPYTVKGYGIRRQWKSFAERMPHMTEADFSDRLDDEQQRAVIYAVGTNDFKKEDMTGLEAAPLFSQNPAVLPYFVIAGITAQQFTHADNAVAHYVSTSSGGGGGGGGAGGGGGGAGAF
ncbi:DUF2207 domain-containing protein [Sporosarcina trichiuri]|uniref:DUF2207 domain-containing protein n=1 Tax=Sporosarcina trichiuri TaxID=3056445 RepID=UPI0025B45C78|nr:DUF2207 domain-containing protein [Sporosarcina sp. 0.2-SM1T-5]WJY27268.1 DUF2207 domain-containing protein [Sporosarcina sp. 0.2-SM1T-5]